MDSLCVLYNFQIFEIFPCISLSFIFISFHCGQRTYLAHSLDFMNIVWWAVFSKVRYLRLVLWSQALVTMLQDGALLGSLPIFLLCFSSLYTGVWGICSVCPEKLSSALAVSLSVLSRGKLVLTSPSTPVTHVLRGAPGYNSWWWW